MTAVVSAATAAVEEIARVAIATVHDPEYPGVSIVDLGLLESVNVRADGTIDVGLIPTFSGCPALAIIATDVEEALRAACPSNAVSVQWLRSPVWSADRITDEGRAALAAEFTVAVEIGRSEARCPRCGSPTSEQSMFGPSRCRSVHRCESCHETVEVMRA